MEGVPERMGPLDYEFEKYKKAMGKYEEVCAAFVKAKVESGVVKPEHEERFKQMIQKHFDENCPEDKFSAKERKDTLDSVLQYHYDGLKYDEYTATQKEESSKKRKSAC